jgi:hypothetical protein
MSAPGGNRSPDAGLRTASLYPLSYGGGSGRSYHLAVLKPMRLVLYERDGCHLCEEARVLLDKMLGPDGYARVDIDADDDLVLRYGFRIPVVALDGVDRLDGPITAPDLRPLLRELEG